MLRNIGLLLVILGLVGLLTYWDSNAGAPAALPPPPPPVATANSLALPVPAFTFTDLNGKTHDIADFKGKTILLNFWASWCAPCLIEFPKMLALANQYPDQLVWLAVSVDSSKDALTNFTGQYPPPPANALMVWDSKKAIAQDLFQSIRYPETILIGPDFKMHRKIVGDTDWTGAEMEAELKALFATAP